MRRHLYKSKKYKYKKVYLKRKRKSFLCSRLFWFLFLLLISAGATAYFLFFSSFFQIKEIKISGNQKISIEDLREIIYSQLDKKITFVNLKNIFLIDLNKINKMILEKYPQIAEVNLNREFPDVLAAQIGERKPVAVFYRDESWFFIDKEGVVFEETSEVDSKMAKIKDPTFTSEFDLGEKLIEEDLLNYILKINAELNNIETSLDEILIVSAERLDIKTSEGWEAYFNQKKDLDWQLTELVLLLEEKIPPEKRENLKYIDLRFEKIYIYPEI